MPVHIVILVFTIAVKSAFGVIYTLNETDYSRMPALFALDDYDSCMTDPGGVYCVVDVDLFSTEQSDLMDMILEYSAYKVKHYNHTQIHRGVCLSTCPNFRNYTKLDPKLILEECVNQILHENYALQGKVAEVRYCKRHDDVRRIAISDVVVAVIYLVLILMNIIGSFHDIYWCEDLKSGNPYLLAFSVRQNWKRLTAPAGVGSDSRLKRLKLFHGLRTMTMVCVIFSHTVFIMAYSYVDNPLYIEKSYEDPFKQILFNGSLVTHTFFMMSSFLLAYNFQLHSEKHEISWIQFPKGILLRWLRLTPTYALALATICTLWRFFGDGPLWRLVVESEVYACKQYWWAHLVYINNYIYEDNACMPQTWYLAADTQLFCLGLFICVAARTPKARKISLILLLVASIIIVACHTYFQDLDAVVLQAPESYRSIYGNDNTFRLVYIQGHTNISTYTLGLAGGFLTYHWQKNDLNINKYKKYRFLFWLTFPLGVAVILSGGLFYMDGVEPAILLKVLYASLYKIVFQILVVVLIIGVIFKLEDVYRGIVEWRGFSWTGRVSYSAFIVHTFFQRGFGGIQTTTMYMSDYYVLTSLAGYIFLTFMGAAALYIFVESPANGVVKALLTLKRKKSGKKVSPEEGS